MADCKDGWEAPCTSAGRSELQDDSDSDVKITGTKQAHTMSKRRAFCQEPRVDKPAAAAVAPFTAAASEDGPSAAAAKKRKPSRSREEAPAEATAAAAAAAVPVAAASVDSASASSAKRRKGSMSDRVRAVAANQMGAAADGAAAAGPAVVDSIPSQLTAEDRAAITPELISQRNRDCGRWFSNPFLSRKLRAKPLEGTPFLPALSNRSPPTKHLSRMHFAGRDFDVRVLDGHLCVNFTELLIALLETDLFQPLPPGGESFVPPSLAANPRADMEWLYWYTYFLWPPGRYGADVWLTRAPWGIVVVENTCMLQVPAGHPPETGTPWITVHLLHMLSELYHLKLDDTDTRPLLKARDELRQAYMPLLQWEREAGGLQGRPADAVHVCQALGKAYKRRKQEKAQRAV